MLLCCCDVCVFVLCCCWVGVSLIVVLCRCVAAVWCCLVVSLRGVVVLLCRCDAALCCGAVVRCSYVVGLL